MKTTFSRLATALPVSLVAIFVASVAFAASYSLFGEASLVQPGFNSPQAVEMVSDADPGYGGIDFAVPGGTTFADLTTLSTDFNVTDDDCGGGSPRFQINMDNGAGDTGNIFVYLGPPPGYIGCVPNTWTSSGDLLEGVNPIDTTQLDAGAFYDPYATALIKYGSYMVTGIQLVTDAGWAFGDGEQTIRADNVTINSDVHTFEDKDSCKKGGWQNFTSSPGPFKNQGQCVSYFARNK